MHWYIVISRSSNNPNFNDDSYVSYPSINESLETVPSRSYILRTETKLSLILCNGQISGTDYILLNLSSSFVQFRYDWGSGPVVMEKRCRLYLNEWHTVNVVALRTGWTAICILIINGIDSRRTSPGTDNLLQLGKPLYSGGIPDTANVWGSVVEAGYVGCIRNLRLSPTNELMDFIIDSLDSINITVSQHGCSYVLVSLALKVAPYLYTIK